jgi:hypothetical protein
VNCGVPVIRNLRVQNMPVPVPVHAAEKSESRPGRSRALPPQGHGSAANEDGAGVSGPDPPPAGHWQARGAHLTQAGSDALLATAAYY